MNKTLYIALYNVINETIRKNYDNYVKETNSKMKYSYYEVITHKAYKNKWIDGKKPYSELEHEFYLYFELQISNDFPDYFVQD